MAERSDGSTAAYYELPEYARELQDLISHRNMNAQVGEIFRACYRYGLAEHSDQLRDAKKMRFYAQAEIDRLERNPTYLGHCNVIGENTWVEAAEARGLNPERLVCVVRPPNPPENAVACFRVRCNEPMNYLIPKVQEWVQRLRDEHRDLQDRHDRLKAFLGSKQTDEISTELESLLIRQEFLMEHLLAVLRDRIELAERSA